MAINQFLIEISYSKTSFREKILVRSCLRSLVFLSNLRALAKLQSRDQERQNREEPGRKTTSPLCVFAFKLLKPLNYAGYLGGGGGKGD